MGGRARESLRFVEKAPIKQHATNVTASFPARVEGERGMVDGNNVENTG